ncbi:hypothetical protein WDU94_003592, partial [Cyamophila willieti]
NCLEKQSTLVLENSLKAPQAIFCKGRVGKCLEKTFFKVSTKPLKAPQATINFEDPNLKCLEEQFIKKSA